MDGVITQNRRGTLTIFKVNESINFKVTVQLRSKTININSTVFDNILFSSCPPGSSAINYIVR